MKLIGKIFPATIAGRLFCVMVIGMAAIGIASASSPFEEVAAKLAGKNSSGLRSALSIGSEQAAMKAEVAPSDPEVEFEYLWPAETGKANRWSVGISQELPDFRKIKATGRVVAAMDSLKIYSESARAKENLYAARCRLVEYIGARKELELLSYVHENFDSLIAAYTRAWERGEVTILDLNKLKIEHARAYAANEQAAGNVKSMENEIIALSFNTISHDELESLTDYPAFILNEEGNGVDNGNLAELIKASAAVKEMEWQKRTAAEKVNLASKSRFPGFSLGYTHAYEDATHFNGFSASMTLPVYSRKSEVMESRLALDAVTLEGEQLEADLLAEATTAMEKASALRRQIGMLAPAVENTNNMRLLKMALEGGEINLLEYLQETGYFTDASREYNVARMEYALAVASLMRYLPD